MLAKSKKPKPTKSIIAVSIAKAKAVTLSGNINSEPALSMMRYSY